jgi:carboxyl-terminal processing protease
MRLDRKTHNRIIRTILFAACLLPSTLLQASQVEKPVDKGAEEGLPFTKVCDTVATNFADPVDPDRAIFDGAIRGMLATLDPFCSFLDPDQYQQQRQFEQGETRGFGSVLFIEPGKVQILQVAPDSPSSRAGLGPGDEIVEINGQRCDHFGMESLVELLKRVRSQPVRLGVIHPGEVVAHDHRLDPAELHLPTVDKSFLLQPGVAYIHISSFDPETVQEAIEAIKQLGGTNLQGLLLDLRGNHGGVLDAAVGLASLFLRPDVLVVTQRGRAVPEKSSHTVAEPAHSDVPLVVLVNGETAGAAEVLAAALQEHDRALIAGEPTMGKGVVESLTALSAGTGLRLTTALYFTPEGRSIQRPLPGTALGPPHSAPNNNPGPARRFHTDDGQPIPAGGRIAPDVAIPAPKRDPWIAALDTHGTFTSFASEYLTTHAKVDRSFEPDAQILALFQDYLKHSRLQVPQESWEQNQDYLKRGIKAGLLTLIFGLSAGDQVMTRGDPQVQKALGLFPEIPTILGPREQSAIGKALQP